MAAARRFLWATVVSFGLRADLDQLPPHPRAKVPLEMEPVDAAAFRGFEQELERVGEAGAPQVEDPASMSRQGVAGLYVAHDPGGAPMYAQWLIRCEEQASLHAAVPRLFPHLEEGESLLEGAYTFQGSRRLGAMSDGMHQLLVRSRDAGDARAYTYVGTENIASLRGCANAGFRLDHVRVTKRRLGRRQVERREPTDAERTQWERAIAPR